MMIRQYNKFTNDKELFSTVLQRTYHNKFTQR